MLTGVLNASYNPHRRHSSFSQQFEEAVFSVGTWHNEPGVMPWFNYDEAVVEFEQILCANDWVTPTGEW
jgi:hypothetical protein